MGYRIEDKESWTEWRWGPLMLLWRKTAKRDREKRFGDFRTQRSAVQQKEAERQRRLYEQHGGKEIVGVAKAVALEWENE